MKPGLSLAMTISFFSTAPSARAASSVSSLVSKPRTISISGMTGTGLKKCSPTTLSGRCVAEAISVIDSEDVLDARIASGLQITSSSVKSVFFNVMFSVAASITRSQ